MINSITLSELTYAVKSAICLGFPESIWVTAEISELHVNKSGHGYLELIEKEIIGDRIIARMRATAWANVFRNIKPFFENITGYTLAAGIKVMLLVQPEFHEVYGLSLNIKDIDPSYTLGDIARRKQEVIKRLKEEGVIDMNKMLQFPPVSQRIAIISSETAAGYGDFIDTLKKNIYGFCFNTTLFPAVMQGARSEASIISALETVFVQMDFFDVVVIIRGGGAQSELDTFNAYNLAFHITQFPLPVITGIGHERDDTIADIVAHTALKTPTAVAEFIITKALNFKNLLDNFLERITAAIQQTVHMKKGDLERKSFELNMLTFNTLEVNKSKVKNLQVMLFKTISQFIENKDNKLSHNTDFLKMLSLNKIKEITNIVDNYLLHITKNLSAFFQKHSNLIQTLSKNIQYLNPDNILARGFTITSLNGKILKSSSVLKKDDIIDTLFLDGIVNSKIELIKKK